MPKKRTCQPFSRRVERKIIAGEDRGVRGGRGLRSQCAHWLRNDRDFHMGCGARPFSGRPGGRPLHTSIVKRSVGADAHIGPVAPALKKSVGRRLDAPPLSTRTITVGCGHPALRKRNKMCRARATARVAPTGAWQEVRRVLCLRGRRRGYPCSTKAARVRVSGQRL